MPENSASAPAAEKRHKWRLPLVFTAMLLLASCCLCAYIWNSYLGMKAEAEAKSQEYAALREQENYLQSLLALSPCEAARKFQEKRASQ